MNINAVLYRSRMLGAAVAVALTAGALVAPTASAVPPLCVGARHGCYHSLQAAIDAATPGATIRILAGSVPGGAKVTKDLTIVGAGPTRTRIVGGGPVLTLGSYGASDEPTVSISRVTITAGITRSSELSDARGAPGLIALGGGIEIPPNADFSGGAAVTIIDTVISGNRVAPSVAQDVGPPCPGNRLCPFAEANGGGIDNWGELTLRRVEIVHNRVGSASHLSDLASDAYGGGIQSWSGNLTIDDSMINDNQATVSAPNGRFADSGGVFVEGGALAMSRATISNNVAAAYVAFPASVDTLAIAGGIHVASGVSARLDHTTIAHNDASMHNSAGPAFAFSGGAHTDDTFTLDRDVIADNTVTAIASGRTGDAEADSGAGEIGGTITDTQLLDNHVIARAAAGDAYALGGAAIAVGIFVRTTVVGNRLWSRSSSGAAIAAGAGLDNGGDLALRFTTVGDNHGVADGPNASAQGGGVFSAATNYAPPATTLAIDRSVITDNSVDATTAQGGGIYTATPIQLVHAVVAANRPDQIFKSAMSIAARRPRAWVSTSAERVASAP